MAEKLQLKSGDGQRQGQKESAAQVEKRHTPYPRPSSVSIPDYCMLS